MPVPLNPARMTGLARGLTLVEGGGNAARMRALVRKARATGAGTEAERAAVERAGARAAPRDMSLDVLGPEGYERTVTRQPGARYSPEATATQEAEARHAAARRSWDAFMKDQGYEDPRQWLNEPDLAQLKSDLGPTRKDVPEDLGTLARTRAEALRRSMRRTAELRDKLGLSDEDMLAAFRNRYGWQPQHWADAEALLSPEAYNELLESARPK